MKFEARKRKKNAFSNGFRLSELRLNGELIKSGRYLLVAPAVAVLVIALRTAGVLQLLEWAAYDQLMRLRPVEPLDPRIVVVTVDESDIQQVGQWPVPDGKLAQLLTKLKQHQPVAIGLDLYRDLPVQPGHQDLVQLYQSTPNLMGVEKVVSDDQGAVISPPTILKENNQVAAADLVIDEDGKVRRAVLSLQPPDSPVILNLGLQMALMYLQQQEITPEIQPNGEVKLGQAVFTRFTGNDGGYVRADAGGYQILLNYRGLQDKFKMVSMSDVLADRISPDLMRDRIVMIGATAQSLNDLFFTPYSSSVVGINNRTPGVIIHANIASLVLSSAKGERSLIHTVGEYQEWLWILLWSGIGTTLGWAYRATHYTVFSLALAGGSLSVVCYVAFVNSWWIPWVPPLLGLLTSGVAIIACIANLERQDRQTLMSLFGQHLTPKIADEIWRSRHELLTQGQLVSHKMTATVLFADVRNFSSIAEDMEPSQLMAWLNEYMNAMADIVLSWDGIVDKFIGDAIMAVFGVPVPRSSEAEIAQDAIAAVSCAVEMAEKLQWLNQKWRRQGQPTISMRVGIATGTVVTGSLGSAQRMDYTTLGDTVNIAARLESYDKSFGHGICRILISKATHHYIQPQFPTHLVGSLQLKGRQQRVDVYQVINQNKPYAIHL